MKLESFEAVHTHTHTNLLHNRFVEHFGELHFSKESATLLLSLIKTYKDKYSKAMCFRGS